MALTLGNWVLVGILAIAGIIISICIWRYRPFGEDPMEHRGKYIAITMAGTIAVVVALMSVLHWYHTSTAAGARSYKDFKTNFDNGLVREVTITAEDGREIFHYEGKIDIEDNENYILFESEDGRRYIIYYGKLDTVMIVEKQGVKHDT